MPKSMPKSLSMLNTIRGSQLEHFYPRGWDLKRIDRCCAMNLKQLTTRARHWHKDFKAIPVDPIGEPMGKSGGTNTMKIVRVEEHRS